MGDECSNTTMVILPQLRNVCHYRSSSAKRIWNQHNTAIFPLILNVLSLLPTTLIVHNNNNYYYCPTDHCE